MNVWRLKSKASRLFVQKLVWANIKKHRNSALHSHCEWNPPATGGFPFTHIGTVVRKTFLCNAVILKTEYDTVYNISRKICIRACFALLCSGYIFVKLLLIRLVHSSLIRNAGHKIPNYICIITRYQTIPQYKKGQTEGVFIGMCCMIYIYTYIYIYIYTS